MNQGRLETLRSSPRHSPRTISEVLDFLLRVHPTALLFVLHSDALEVVMFLISHTRECVVPPGFLSPFITVAYCDPHAGLLLSLVLGSALSPVNIHFPPSYNHIRLHKLKTIKASQSSVSTSGLQYSNALANIYCVYMYVCSYECR